MNAGVSRGTLIDRHLINGDATFASRFLDIAIR
jgi:hypothetical protein